MAHGQHHGQGNSEEEQKIRMQQEMNILKNLNQIKHKVMVMSGKGGVGKSTITANLAETFRKQGLKVGILDADIHGPNIPKLFATVDEMVKVEDNKFQPVLSESGIELMSIEYMLQEKGSSIIWRGPQKIGAIRQFFSDVNWGQLDVLLIDNPPGTGDEPLTVMQTVPLLDAVIMVTTPNGLSKEDVYKSVNFANTLNKQNIGLVENMAYYICPHCGEELNIFGDHDGEAFAKELGIDYLESIPVAEDISKSADTMKIASNVNKDIEAKFKNLAELIQDKYFK